MNNGLSLCENFIQVMVFLYPLLWSLLDVALSQNSFYIFEELRELSFLLNCFWHRFLSSVVHEWVPIVEEEQETDLSGGILSQDVLDSDEVL